VSEDRGHPGDQGGRLRSREPTGHKDGERSLANIEEEDGDPIPRAEDPIYIRRSEVTTPLLANIDPADRLTPPEAEGK
jgi:hypothetical protein